MRRRWYIGLTLFLGMLLTPISSPLQAQEKKIPGPKQERLNATVHSVSKDTSSFTVRRGTEDRQVVYSPQTTITMMNKPSSADEIKEGRRVICLGKINAKNELEASQIDIRENVKPGK